MTTPQERARRLFDVVRRKDPAERAAFLEGLSGADHDLRDELLSLLAAADGRETLGSPEAADTPGPDDEMPERIGPYRVLRQIGVGGMGVV